MSGLAVAGLLLGSWPDPAGVVHATNAGYLQRHCAAASIPWLGRIPEQAGLLSGPRFREGALHWLASTADVAP